MPGKSGVIGVTAGKKTSPGHDAHHNEGGACAGPLPVANFSIDHHNPISRDGDFSISNILVCDLRCNKIKGNLTSHEFLHLMTFLAQFPQEVGKDVLARLYAGGSVMRRR